MYTIDKLNGSRVIDRNGKIFNLRKIGNSSRIHIIDPVDVGGMDMSATISDFESMLLNKHFTLIPEK